MLHIASQATCSIIAIILPSFAAAPGPRATPTRPAAHAAPAQLPAGLAAPAPTHAHGEIVTEIDRSCWVIYQDKDLNHWFGSDGQGISRFDGKSITRFTTKHGLAHDQIRGISQHAPTGHILITTNGGVSMFDGERFTTLTITENTSPQLPYSADSLKHAGWNLNDTDTWLSGAGGPRIYDGATLRQLKFPKSPHEDAWRAKHPEVRWNPYDVWTVYKDNSGHMWFGTGGMGVCRFDGQSLDWLYEAQLTEVPGAGWFGFRSIIEHTPGSFYICNSQYRFDVQPHGVEGQQQGLITYQRSKGMDWSAVDDADDFIFFQAIIQDNTGDLWMTPYMGGVWRHDGRIGTHYPMVDAAVPHDQIKIISISKDRTGDIWLATQEHGPYRFTGTAFEKFKPST